MSSRLEKNALYFALFVAWVATLGSLYFSNVRHFEPCEWCWRQRILMYPLIVILSVGLLRKDEQLSYYSATISGLGVLASTYHYLLQKTTWFDSVGACIGGVACSLQYINWLGFMTIPFLALIAFMLIFFSSIVVLTSNNHIWEEEDPTLRQAQGPPPWPLLLSIIAFALLPMALSFLPAPPKPDDSSVDDPFPPSGATLYSESCAACHGADGKGVQNLGSALVGGDFTLNTPDEAWISFVREGRPADHPDNKSGIAMPPSGGRPDLTDNDLQAILSFLRLESK